MKYDFCHALKIVYFLKFVVDLGKVPTPFTIQSKSISGKTTVIFKIKSELGLFLPEKRCKILDRCTSIYLQIATH
jgi:hypothetical protein